MNTKTHPQSLSFNPTNWGWVFKNLEAEGTSISQRI